MLSNTFINWLKSKPAVRRPLVMGILNVTPDSFSDGGQFNSTDTAVAYANQMRHDGADLIDIGGESTRPGALAVPADEQVRRVLPVISKLGPDLISIDTTSSAVALAALSQGLSVLINDVSAGIDDSMMLPLAARFDCPIILMHRPGPSATMQAQARYGNVVSEVCAFLQERLEAALSAGIGKEMILLDPGIGFGKTMEHDLMLLRDIKKLKSLGQPLVIGVSRKKFIGRLTGEENPARRTFGTAAAVSWSVACGADIVRVHDVAAMKQTVAVASEFRRPFSVESKAESNAESKTFRD